MAYNKNGKKSYTHFIPPVKEDPKWADKFKFDLVTSIEELEGIFKDFEDDKTILAFDLETSGLDPENSFIVGVCLCFDYNSMTGYYVPINHFDDDYNLYDEGLDLIYDYLNRAKMVLVYNAKFETRFMEYHSFNKKTYDYISNRLKPVKYDISKVKIYDVSIGVYYADTNIKMPSLKDSSLHFLGFRQESFLETLEDASNFHYVDPKRATMYGAADAICTYWLAMNTIKYYKEGGYSGTIDNKFLYPLTHYENERILIDGDYLKNLDSSAQIKANELERKIFEDVGDYYNLNSPQQVSDMFSRMGIDTGRRTKTGYMSTGIELLENLPDRVKEDNPILKDYILYKQIFKNLSSYIKPLYKEYEDRGYLRCNYKTQEAPTGRLASGKDSKNTFFSPVNIQSTPKPHPGFYYVYRVGDDTIFSKENNIIMGYQFIKASRDDSGDIINPPINPPDNSEFLGVAEGSSIDLNVRKGFLPNLNKDMSDAEDWIWCGIDYAAQELRIPANISREPVWVDAFTTGKDVHKETAVRLMGEENYDKEARKKAKGCSSLNSYVLTQRGLVKTGKLKEEDQLLSIDGKFQSYKYEIEERDCLKIEFDNGITDTVTKDHLYASYDDNKKLSWVRADSLDIGSSLHVGRSRGSFSEEYYKMGDICLDEDLAYALAGGIIDGCIYTNNDAVDSWSIAIKNQSKKDKLMTILEKYGEVELKGYTDYSVAIVYNKNLCDFIRSVFFEKGIPDVIFTSPLKVVLSFIEGCLDSNGYSHTIYSFNNDVLSDLALLLSCMGAFTLRDGNALSLITYGNKDGFEVKVSNIVESREKVFVMETEHHTYLSNMIESHNCNFGVLYGMTSDSLAETYKMKKAEADEFYFKFKKTLSILFAWADRVCKRAQKEGTVYNYFSRPRRVRFYFENNPGFAKRTAVNNTVQGTASDILKISLIALWNKVFKKDEYRNYIRFLTTVHDEIDFSIHKSKLKELALICMDIMRFKLDEWPVVIDVEASFGWSWGELFEFGYDGERDIFYPKVD